MGAQLDLFQPKPKPVKRCCRCGCDASGPNYGGASVMGPVCLNCRIKGGQK